MSKGHSIFKMLVTTCSVTQCRTSEQVYLQHSCENLRFHVTFVYLFALLCVVCDYCW